MKKILFIAAMFLIILSVVLTACEGGVGGKYIGQDGEDTTRFLLLSDDGTFLLESDRGRQTGKWKVTEDVLVLYTDDNNGKEIVYDTGNIKDGEIAGIKIPGIPGNTDSYMRISLKSAACSG